MAGSLNIIHKGLIPYSDAEALQRRMWEQRRDGLISDTLILLEHPPVVTIGVRKDGERDVLFSATELQKRGFALFKTDRGGLATLHLPGQIVGYFFVEVKKISGGLRGFIDRIEQGLIQTCRRFGLETVCGADEPGIWTGAGVDLRKLASLGLSVRSGISRHGFALNVDPDLSMFQVLRPCGHTAETMTSLARELNRPVDKTQVAAQLESDFRGLFEYSS